MFKAFNQHFEKGNFWTKRLFGENWETEGEKNIEQTFEFVKTITISRNLANNTLSFKLYKGRSRFKMCQKSKTEYKRQNIKK